MNELQVAASSALGVGVVETQWVNGGDLNDAWKLTLADGRKAFLKTNDSVIPGTYRAEAAGLTWLAEPQAVAIPDVLAVADDDATEHRFLILEWIDNRALTPDSEEQLGRGLANIHAAGAPAFGATGNNPTNPTPTRFGAVELSNVSTATWPEFYAHRRIRPLAHMAADRGVLDAGGVTIIDSLCEQLAENGNELAGPPEPPARLHGDLWGGNVFADADGRPYLIDPAAHGGHREIDLAMLRLFGSPSERCFDAYQEITPLAEGHEDRVELWQLAPILLHAVLFGGGYGRQATSIAKQYLN